MYQHPQFGYNHTFSTSCLRSSILYEEFHPGYRHKPRSINYLEMHSHALTRQEDLVFAFGNSFSFVHLPGSPSVVDTVEMEWAYGGGRLEVKVKRQGWPRIGRKQDRTVGGGGVGSLWKGSLFHKILMDWRARRLGERRGSLRAGATQTRA